MARRVDTLMVIPARGGSRSVPGKNVKALAGRPLITWVLDAGAAAPEIDAIIVSTDDPHIEAAAGSVSSKKITCFRRSPETATDTASTESALMEVAVHVSCNTLVLVQATSPFVSDKDISGALAVFHDSGADSLLTVVRQKRFIWETTEAGWARPVNYDPDNRPRRQDFPGYMVENGAIYICRRDGFLEHGSRLFGRIATYEMSPESYVELDEPSDWRVVETLISSRQYRYDPRLERIRLVLCDIDGVLTDAGMYYSEAGDELKKFSTYDGQAVALLTKAGIRVGLITRETCTLNARRADKISVDFLEQGADDKVSVAQDHLERLGLEWFQVAYIGDDVNDIALLRRAGYAVAPANAMSAAKGVSDCVLATTGGHGCLREFAELLLDAYRPIDPAGAGSTVDSNE